MQRCTIDMQPLRNRCATAMQLQCNRCAITGKSLQNHYSTACNRGAIGLHSLNNRSTISALRCTISAQILSIASNSNVTLYSRFEIASQTLCNCFKRCKDAQLMRSHCEIVVQPLFNQSIIAAQSQRLVLDLKDPNHKATRLKQHLAT
jgi:hypothetical protein